MSLTDIIAQDPHILAIEPSEHWDFPQIDYALFRKQKIIEPSMSSIKYFLGLRYIRDDFEGQQEGQTRRKWFVQKIPEIKSQGFTEKEYFNFYKENCLRMNHLNGLSLSLEYLSDNYSGPRQEEVQEKIRQVSSILPRDSVVYDELTNQQKYERVKLIKQRTFEVLQFLGEVSKPPV